MSPRSHPLVGGLARFGYFARGVLYLAIGAGAARAAILSHTKALGPVEALQSLLSGPYGKVLVALIGAGFAALGVFRLIRARTGRSRGRVSRAADVVRAAGDFALAATCLGLELHLSAGRSGALLKSWAKWVFAREWGRFLVAAVGAGALLGGLLEILQALRRRFREDFVRQAMSPRGRTWAIRITRIGLAAHGGLLLLVGTFVLRAARDANPREMVGPGGALSRLSRFPHGSALLAAVSVGLVAYGLSLWVLARYRRS